MPAAPAPFGPCEDRCSSLNSLPPWQLCPLPVSTAPRSHSDNASPQLLLFTGKGGVGKSTLVAALGVAAACRGERPLIVELGHRASMASIFPGATIEHRPRPIACEGRLAAMNIEQDEALFDFIAGQVKVRPLARAIAGNASLRGLFGAAPAVREVITLAKIEALARARDDQGHRRWQPILVDLDATGHALMLLELPQLLRALVGSGPLRRLTESLSALITDRQRTVLSLVTLAREVPVQETIELAAEIEGRHGIAVAALLINQVPHASLPPSLWPWLEIAGARAQKGSALAAELDLAARVYNERQVALAQIARLRAELPKLAQIELPAIEGGPRGLEDLRRLGEIAMRGLGRAQLGDCAEEVCDA